jgi:uncharacterized protein YjbI with pentapeptide repeats
MSDEPMADRPDPFDVKELQSAVNDSATRVSAIWVSFIVFALYLLVAATTVTQKQLLLAEPVKLPVLNIDLPLWGFFFLAPILFVIFHLYTLLQVLLLGRTTAAYNASVEPLKLSSKADISLRQRLANTLLAQIFAGSPREREGFIGWLMRAIVWITLAIAPILVVLAFQFSFLPYHSHFVTWSHRLLILAELLAFFLIWPLALDAQKNFQWPNVGANLNRLTVIPLQLFGPKEVRHEARLWLREHALLLLACILYLLIPLSLATFPGEPHVNLFTVEAWSSVQCKRWVQQDFNLIDLRFDRLILPRVDVVDYAKLERIEEATKKAGEEPFQGERTYVLRKRDLNCGDFSNADLRRVDLSGSSLRGARLFQTRLQGGLLSDTYLQTANLVGAALQHANLINAELQGAWLNSAELQGTHLAFAKLQGAKLIAARLEGARLNDTELQGTDMNSAWLQGADLSSAWLQGAELKLTHLQGAKLHEAKLQGADLQYADLQGADLTGAWLAGADFSEASLDHSVLGNASIWRTQNATCTNARIANLQIDNVIGKSDFGNPIPATGNAIARFIERSIAQIPDAGTKARAAELMRNGLVIDPANDDTEAIVKVWNDCKKAETSTMPQGTFDEQHVAILRKLACDGSPATAGGIVRN